MKYQSRFLFLKVECSSLWHNQDYDYEEKIKLVEKITLNDIVTIDTYENDSRIDILKNIKEIYAKVNPYVFYESIIVAVIFGIFCVIRKRNYEKIIFLLGIVGIYLCRVFIISFTYTTMYTDAINVMYLSVTYVVQSIFVIYANIFLIQEIKNMLENLKLKK